LKEISGNAKNFIREVLGSSLGRILAELTFVFVVFFVPTGKHLEWATTDFYEMGSN
jgi:hypothetical protein